MDYLNAVLWSIKIRWAKFKLERRERIAGRRMLEVLGGAAVERQRREAAFRSQLDGLNEYKNVIPHGFHIP